MTNAARAFDLLIFDLDGTLVDSAADIQSAANRLRADYQLPPLTLADVKSAIGDGTRDLVTRMIPENSPDTLVVTSTADFLRYYSETLTQTTRVYPGVINFLRAWPNAVALVTNKSERMIAPILTATKLDQFKWVAIYGGDTFAARKPDPLPLLEAMKAASRTINAQVDAHAQGTAVPIVPAAPAAASRARTLMIGDGQPDAAAARAAGITAIGALYGYSSRQRLSDAGAAHFINSFADLAPLIESLALEK